MRTAIALFSCLLAACSSTSVGVDKDPDYDFRGKRTYAWKEGVPADNELNQKRIVTGVDRALQQHGLVLTEDGAPDLWVQTEVSYHREVRSSGTSVGFGVGGYSGHCAYGIGTSTGNDVYEVEVGTLIITLQDGSSEETVWRAQAEGTVSNDPEETAAKIQEAIDKSFEKFPIGKPGE
jgi:hypothetical protein